MKCPYCNAEMKDGYLKASHAISWGSDRELGYFPEDIKLAPVTWKGLCEGVFVQSCHCPACKKIIVSLE